MRLRTVFVCLALAAPACASPPKKLPEPASPGPLAAAQSRGQALAERVCAQCHAVGDEGDSPDRRAPPFRSLSGEYVTITLQRKLTEIAETGHYAMPATPVHFDEADDLVAYINSLERR